MTLTNAGPRHRLPQIDGIISDLDGVTYRGADPIESAVRAFQEWHEAGVPYGFVTNNSTKSPSDFSQKLTSLGIPAEAAQVVTSAQVAAQKANDSLPERASIFVIGSNALREEIEKQGFLITDTNAEGVVVGLDRQFNFDKLKKAQSAILDGACFIGTNPDPKLPTETGFEPGAGSILRAIETATGVAPTVVGKPKPDMVERALQILKTQRENTVLIGDQIRTDIYAGHSAGLKTVYVKTGVVERGPFDVLPDFVVETLEELQPKNQSS